MSTPSQALIEAVRAGCIRAREDEPCRYPECTCAFPHGLKASLASVLKREPGEEMLKIGTRHAHPSMQSSTAREMTRLAYKDMNAQLLRELGLEEKG